MFGQALVKEDGNEFRKGILKMNFSNDDPYALDLGDEFKHHFEDDKYSYSYSAADEYEPTKPKFVFYSEEDLVTSAIFQKHLGMALKHKDRKIMELMNELLNRGVQ